MKEFFQRLWDDYRAWYIVHRAKTIWTYSGFRTGTNAVRTDAGTIRSAHKMRLSQALKYLQVIQPGAVCVEISHRHKIIFFSI